MNFDEYLLTQAYDHDNNFDDTEQNYIYCVVDPTNKELLFSSEDKNESFHNTDIYQFGRVPEEHFFNYKYFEEF